MKKLILNGPNIHPGAVGVEDTYGRYIDLNKMSLIDRRKIVMLMGAGGDFIP